MCLMAVVGCVLCSWIIYNIVSGVMRLAGGQVSGELGIYYSSHLLSFRMVSDVPTMPSKIHMDSFEYL